ncbi:hypothetical protein PNBC_07690 [Paenibacillus crassostreae]|uniref:Serine protease n=2 Tax=Paenibacillus crassostreae TaxID=1763538 RepID=A0A167EWW6_9BACL|nr:hypothetical protein LPB68_15330 [Paenibacillus crassostreae]OAB75956.1 hypothetical protein PNBC_07690 [Paenibacillus crassostreae]
MKKRIARSMLTRSDVHGIGVGYKDPNDPKKGAAVIIYSNKNSSTFLGHSSRLTTKVKGKATTVPVRIVKSGKLRSFVDYKSRIRPVPAGYSIGTTGGSGTVGLIVTNVPNAKQRYILSNNHVLNPTNSSANTETIQPGGADGGQSGRDRVGRLSRYVQLRQNQNNRVDVALSTPVRNRLLSPSYATVGILPGYVTTYRVGERLKKVGRTTGLVSGIVDSVDTDILVDYGESIGVLKFVNQTVIRGVNPVSLPGDSGSVWLRQVDNYAAAVNYAGSADGMTSIAFPVNWAMQIFRTGIARKVGTGKIKRVKTNKSPLAYVRQLTPKELTRLKVLQVRRIKK